MTIEFTSEHSPVNSLDDINPGDVIQVVQQGQELISGGDYNAQDFAFQSAANDLLVLRQVDRFGEWYEDDYLIPLDNVVQIHVY